MLLTAELSDENLLELIRNDDKTAFSEVYQRYAISLAEFCASRLHQIEDAHDVLQDLFVKLWENRHQLNVKGNLKNYLFSALRYRVIDKIRQNATRENYAEMIRPLLDIVHSNNPYEQLKAKDIKKHLEEQLDKLPKKTQRIYKLSREEQLSTKEIAEHLQLPEQTVKNQLTIALKHLRDFTTILLLIEWLNN
ncbi:MAG TPA: RNA polymerase sigma-70 factor [Niabella sp.]|nr:RNA polymerase sigma-70 factor [Niabella sp.]